MAPHAVQLWQRFMFTNGANSVQEKYDPIGTRLA